TPGRFRPLAAGGGVDRAPPPLDPAGDALGGDVGPVDVVLERPGEQDGEPGDVGAVLVEDGRRLDQVAARLRHGGAVHHHHALVEQVGEGLGEGHHAEVVEDLDEEAGVEQVQDGVLDAAGVLV